MTNCNALCGKIPEEGGGGGWPTKRCAIAFMVLPSMLSLQLERALRRSPELDAAAGNAPEDVDEDQVLLPGLLASCEE